MHCSQCINQEEFKTFDEGVVKRTLAEIYNKAFKEKNVYKHVVKNSSGYS
jgi:hypothetical protein